MADKQRGIGRPFKKGQSGNPNGRPPKSRALSEELRRLLQRRAPGTKRTNLEVIVDQLVTLARDGDKDALRYVFDRLEGRPAQALELTGDEARPVTFRYIDGNEEA